MSKAQLQAAEAFARTVIFAFHKHAGQTRKDQQRTPYMIHPLRVTEYLRRLAGERDENVLLAAVLHDTLEDTRTSRQEITKLTNADVTRLVIELTNDTNLPKKERRAKMIAHIPELSRRAKRIKLADRLDNVRDLVAGGAKDREKRTRYLKETEAILKGCAGACPPIEKELKKAFGELEKLVEKLR
ncbi:MAG TPA: HD domain-containing protein [Planctomycetota bacterium]|jgi:guanosine-3',5'-bis(diphosphate) 3'-pyrophosphohydrolase